MAAAGSTSLMSKLLLAALLGSAVTGCASVEYTSEAELTAAQIVVPLPKPAKETADASASPVDGSPVLASAATAEAADPAEAGSAVAPQQAALLSDTPENPATLAQTDSVPMAVSFADMPLTAEMMAIQTVVPTPRPGTQLAFAASGSQLGALAAINTQVSTDQNSDTPHPGELDQLIAKYAKLYDVPVELVHRVVHRESRYNPKAYSQGNFGLMQIRYNTAKGLGYDGAPAGLFDAETNLKYAVKYLRGAWLVADNNHDGAVALYSTGYYYDAKRKGMLHLLRN